MGIIDFLFGKKERAKVVESREKFNLEKLDGFIKNIELKIKDEKEEIIKNVREDVYKLVEELDGLIVRLERVDISGKNESEKIKHIVKTNHSLFLDSVARFRGNLKEFTNKENISFLDFFEEIHLLFLNFEKESFKSFQKATYLIGREMGDVIKAVKDFNKAVERVKKEKREFFIKLGAIKKIKESYSEYKDNVVFEKESIKDIGEKECEIKSLKERIGSLKKEVLNIRRSPEYLDKENKKRELEGAKGELELKFSHLKRAIDFKELARTYHSFEKKIAVIKEYKEDFRDAFGKDRGESVIEMVDDVKKEEIKEILRRIYEIEDIIKTLEGLVVEDKRIILLNSEIEALENLIIDLGKEKGHFEKKSQKFKKNKEDLVLYLRESFEKIV